jgi:hypothetical protein
MTDLTKLPTSDPADKKAELEATRKRLGKLGLVEDTNPHADRKAPDETDSKQPDQTSVQPGVAGLSEILRKQK